MAEEPISAHLSKVGAFIREQRRLVRISQRELARAAGLSDSYVSQLERGLHEPSVRALKAIASGLNLSAEQLVSFAAGLSHEDGASVVDSEPAATELAIHADPRLTEPQKRALLGVLESYLAANAEA